MANYGNLRANTIIYDDSGDQTIVGQGSTGIMRKHNEPSITGTITCGVLWNGGGVSLAAIPYIQDLDALAASAQVTIDCSLGNRFTLAQSGVISGFTFTNVPASGKNYMYQLSLTANAQAITWTPTVGGATKTLYWDGGTAPTMSANRFQIIFQTDDGGEKWRAVQAVPYG